MSVRPLTKRQAEVLAFLRTFIATNGYSPSLTEIGAHFGLTAVATVHKHIANLSAKGHIRRQWNMSRSIELLTDCPYCGHTLYPDSRRETPAASTPARDSGELI